MRRLYRHDIQSGQEYKDFKVRACFSYSIGRPYCATFEFMLIHFVFARAFWYHSHFSVNACLMPALAADGCHITTVEGVGSVKGKNLHPVQQAMVDMPGSQCGTCYGIRWSILYASFLLHL